MGFKLKKVIKAVASPVTAATKAVKNNWVSFRDALETAAVIVGNYYLPGSSMLTSRLVSGGAKKNLNSQLGIIAQMSSGIAGANAGNMSNYGKMIDAGKNAMNTGITDAKTWLNDTSTNLFGPSSSGGNAMEAVNTGGASAGSSTTAATQATSGGTAVANSPSVNASNTFPMPGSAAAPYANTSVVPKGNIPAGGGGVLNSIGNWAEKNPTAALMAGNMALSGVGGMMQASGAEKQAEIQRQADIEKQRIAIDAQQSKGGWGAATTAVTANDQNQIVDNQGRYVYGPNAGQYVRPGLINMNRSN